MLTKYTQTTLGHCGKYRDITRVIPAMFLFILMLSVGCGTGVQPVTGTVKLDGKALSDAVVSFVPIGEGSAGAATTDSEGRFSITSVLGAGLAPGKYKVSVTSNPPKAEDPGEVDMNSPEYLKMASSGGTDSAKAKPWKDPIPAKYNSATTLEQEVSKAKVEVNLDLTSK